MKKLILTLMFIFLLAGINAQVSIIENPFTISQKVGTVQTYTITINNSFDFDIQDFKFGNLTMFNFGNVTVLKNSTKIINFSVNPTNSFSGLRNEKIEFRFFTDIPTEITSYPINISSTGFSPTYLTLRQGDTIVWTNRDTIVHNVFSSLFNQNLQPNQTFSYTFNTIGLYTFSDTNWNAFVGFNGNIEVISRTQQAKVHNPNYDFIWNVDTNFFLNPTNVTREIPTTNFTVSATGKTEGLVVLKNIGQEKAEKITFTSSNPWIIFKENNFDLTINEQNIVTFEIDPLIFSTDETNKTYDIQIIIKGSNIDNSTHAISVFVPYAIVSQDSPEAFFGIVEEFCRRFPNNFICNPNQTVVIQGNNTGNNSLQLNISSADYFEQQRRLAIIETIAGRLGLDLNDLKQLYGTTAQSTLDYANKSYEKTLENEKKQRTTKNVLWILGFFTILILGISTLFWKAHRLKKMKIIKEGHYEFRRY